MTNFPTGVSIFVKSMFVRLSLKLGVDFVLPVSQQEQEQEEPLTKIYQKAEI